MPDPIDELGAPGRAVARFRAASIARSAEDLAAVYTGDAVQEFPFTLAGLPSRLDGREAIVEFTAGLWADSPVRYREYETVAAYRTTDPDTVVVRQVVHGTGAAGPFTLPNLIIVTAAGDRIRHLQDFVDVAAGLAAAGMSIPG